MVHRANRQSDWPDYAGRRYHGIRFAACRLVPFLYYGRSDGALWFTENQNNCIGRITIDGRSPSTGFQPNNQGLSASRQVPMAPCGSFKSTAIKSDGSRRPGRLRNSSSLRECQTPCHRGGSSRRFMVYGVGSQPDRTNNMYRGHYRVPDPHPSAEPHGIAVDSGGEVWFAEECDQIGRFIVQYEES